MSCHEPASVSFVASKTISPENYEMISPLNIVDFKDDEALSGGEIEFFCFWSILWKIHVGPVIY